MPGQLVFNEEAALNGNVFKYENRLHTHANKYIENGMLLTTYFSQDSNKSTLDRGTQDIDQLFGTDSPLRYNKILNMPMNGFQSLNPDNTDEQQIEDINVEGDAIILPRTVIPKPYDFFIINHLKMQGLFCITSVSYDSMKVDGFYKVHYRLISTSEETLHNLEMKVVNNYITDLNSVGTNANPIIEKDKFIYRKQVQLMVNKMIESYRALYYNKRHDCFLFYDKANGYYLFDMCGNEFISKYSLMNPENSTNVIMLGDKLVTENHFAEYYNDSIYSWIEMDTPITLLQKFVYTLKPAESYPCSSFARWADIDVQIMLPLAIQHTNIHNRDRSIFDNNQFNSFMNPNIEPVNEYEKIIWKYIHKSNQLTITDVSLETAHALMSSIKNIDTFILTPIVIYIIRQILDLS